MRALLDKQESASREFLKEKGMVFCGVPTDEDEWMKRAVSIWPQFYPQIKNLEIVEAFMKTLGRKLPDKPGLTGRPSGRSSPQEFRYEESACMARRSL